LSEELGKLNGISGYVYMKDTDTPIENARVFYTHEGKEYSGITDKEGKFVIKVE